MKMTYNRRQTKLLKFEYLSNHCSDLPPILNLSFGDQTKTKMIEMMTTSEGRRPQNIKVEYLSNHRSDLPEIFN